MIYGKNWGGASFNVYIFHMSVIIVMLGINSRFHLNINYNNRLNEIALTIIVFIFGIFSHRFIEPRWNNWCRKTVIHLLDIK